MESYCVFLMGQFIATQQFVNDFGVPSTKGGKIIEASWQSAFQCSGPIGAFIGVFIAGPITSWIGYRWATIGGLMFLNAFIQYNSVTRQLASNIRYQFIHHPLSDLFLVYNDTRFRDSGPAGLAQPPSRAVILKLTHLLSF